MERAAEAREALNRQLGDRGKVSFNDVIVKATALALTKQRACNAWFQDDHIRYWNEVHIGVAVGGAGGVLTPGVPQGNPEPPPQIAGGGRGRARKGRGRPPPAARDKGTALFVSNLR